MQVVEYYNKILLKIIIYIKFIAIYISGWLYTNYDSKTVQQNEKRKYKEEFSLHLKSCLYSFNFTMLLNEKIKWNDSNKYHLKYSHRR